MRSIHINHTVFTNGPNSSVLSNNKLYKFHNNTAHTYVVAVQKSYSKLEQDGVYIINILMAL